jgi:lipopolysaccharide transport system ATP-binding protein
VSDLAIQVQCLGKRYLLGETVPYKSLRESLTRALTAPFNRRQRTAREHVWALNDVSFTIHEGEAVGIIGRNGAGKSTLLKVLSRITSPTRGKAEVHGRLGSLLEVGTGFHPELTGRENIFLNGAILGMSRRQIEASFDDIVAFAEVERFLDTPVKRYSSGMYLRLAFSVAAHLEPDILLVDEVLAVGDIEFQKKCLGKMGDIGKRGRTVLLVSHNMPSIANLCKRVILLENGGIAMDGGAQEVIQHYLSSGQAAGGERIWPEPDQAPGDTLVRLHAVRVFQDSDYPSEDVDISKEIRIAIDYWCLQDDARLYSALWLKDKMGTAVLASGNFTSQNLTHDEWYDRPRPAGLYRSICRIPPTFLNEGLYSVMVILGKAPTTTIVMEDSAISFVVHDTGEMRREYYGEWAGVVRPKLAWTTEQLG